MVHIRMAWLCVVYTSACAVLYVRCAWTDFGDHISFEYAHLCVKSESVVLVIVDTATMANLKNILNLKATRSRICDYFFFYWKNYWAMEQFKNKFWKTIATHAHNTQYKIALSIEFHKKKNKKNINKFA